MIFLTPYLQMAFGALGIYLGGGFVWTGFIILFLLLPLVEFLSKDIQVSPRWLNVKMAEASLRLTPVALTGILFLAFWRIQKVEGVAETLGLILSAGTLLGAYGITSAHELVHRRDQKQRALGVYNLMLVNFAHWGLEHVFGHHKNVATPLDPATAQKNEILYLYWLRSYFGGLYGAWKISKEKVIFYFATTAGLATIFYFTGGINLVAFWFALSLVAILLLQTVDYIEHYGLVREKNADGFYMACKPIHSWDTSSLWTNITLFNLGYHSHHHLKANLPFQELKAQESARRMPYGYSVMVPLALLPFVYIPLMNKHLEQSPPNP